MLLPAVYVLSKEPPRYRTTATILIENKADRAPVFQEFSPYRPLPVQLAILESRLLAASVIETLPKTSVDDLIHNPYGRDYFGDLMDWVARVRGKEVTTPSPRRQAIAELRRDRVKFITQPGNSGIVEIQAEASQPQIALDIANTYIEVLLARTRSFNVDDAKSTREYLSQQTAQVSETLARSESALRSFTMSRGGVQIPAKSAGCGAASLPARDHPRRGAGESQHQPDPTDGAQGEARVHAGGPEQASGSHGSVPGGAVGGERAPAAGQAVEPGGSARRSEDPICRRASSSALSHAADRRGAAGAGRRG